MVLTKRFLILATCVLIVLALSLNSQSPTPEKNKESLKDYIGELGKLADSNNEDKFIKIIENHDRLGNAVNVPSGWKENDGINVGQYIGRIIINNLDQAKNLEKIGVYVHDLGNLLIGKGFFTVSRQLLKNTLKVLSEDNAFCARIKSVDGGSAATFELEIANKANQNLMKEKLKGLKGILKEFGKLESRTVNTVNISEKILNELQKKVITLETKMSEKKYLNREDHFFLNHLELFISILYALFLFSIMLGLLALFLKSKTKVKRLGIDNMQSRIDKLRDGKTLEEVKKEEERLARLESSNSSGGTGKKEEKVDIQEGFEILIDGIIEFGTSIEGRLLPKESKINIYEINEKIQEIQKVVNNLDDTTKAVIETRMATVGQELKLTIFEGALKDIGDFFKKIQLVHTGGGQAALSSNQIEEKLVEAERGILRKIWDRIPSADERLELEKRKSEIDEKEDFFRYCVQLETQISFNDKLSSYYKDIFRPLRNYKKKIIEILDTEQMVAVENKEDKKSDTSNRSNDIVEIKYKINFLLLLQNTNEVPGLLALKLENWTQMEFLKFADHCLRTYQQDEFQGKLSQEMKTVRTTILGILSCFDIEPYPIVLGETDFDNHIHKSESWISEPSMIDNVISDVVRNGFRKTDGKVIVVPEVIVNRR